MSAYQQNQKPNVDYKERQFEFGENEITWKKNTYKIKETQQMPMHRNLRKPMEKKYI